MEGLGFPLRTEAVLDTLTEDVLKSSEIEGEKLDRDQVRSSIARRLGIDIGGLTLADRNVDGVVEMILDATQHYDQPLTAQTLVRLARSIVSDRPKRHVEDQSGRMA
jgi:Fic family protein